MCWKSKYSLVMVLALSCLLTILPYVGEAADAGPPGCGNAVVNIQTDANCQVAGFACSTETDQGQPAMRFHLDITNTSGKPQRYRVTITTGSGQTVGGLVPRPEQDRKRVMIGQTEPVSFAIVGVTETPAAINVTVDSVFVDETESGS